MSENIKYFFGYYALLLHYSRVFRYSKHVNATRLRNFAHEFPMMNRTYLCWCAATLVFTMNTCSAIAAAPYLSSTVIEGISWDFSSHDERAPGSDNWPVTWADDGNQYTCWGDGGGFGGTNSSGRVSLGVARVEGPWNSYTGHNVWGGKSPENPAQFEGKSYGIISIGGKLHMWVTPGSGTQGYSEARLATSTNHGATWTRANWAFRQSDELVTPTILQFGQDYAGARDDYVYSYSIRLKDASALKVQKPGQVDLMRVPRDRITDRTSYEFFTGLDTQKNPTWTSDVSARQAVFEDPNGVGWNLSATYNAGLGRYLLCTEHDRTFQGNLGIFDAPQPWGPWTTVEYEQNWGGFGSTFFWNFSNKWTSADGLDTTIVFTGIGDNDSWNTVRGTFSVVMPGDANLDGTVNNKDATLLAANWQKMSGATWGEGDFNDDGKVNDVDATILATNWHSSSGSQASTPEPGMLSLLIGMLLAGLGHRKRSIL